MQDSNSERPLGTPSPFMDSLLGAQELEDLCAHLGFHPPIWHQTERFVSRIESSVDEATIERDHVSVRSRNRSSMVMVERTR